MRTFFFYISVVILIGLSCNAQVGIGTTSPNASLDIAVSSTSSPQNNEGILIPRMDNFPLTNPTANQDGMLVFITGNGTPVKGFYYWDNALTNWVLISGTTGGGGGNTLDQAYDQNGAGLGRTIIATDGAVRVNGEDGFLVTGAFGSGNTIDNEVTGAGTRMFFNPNKAAFRAGNVNGNQWDTTNIGNYSTALGAGTTASATGSVALGLFTEASGVGSAAFGQNNIASQNYGTAFGQQNTVSASNATAFGIGNTASGYTSTAFGDFTTASGIASTAFGLATEATGTQATSFGFDTLASGENATAFGFSTNALEFNSTAFGEFTTASQQFATAFGAYTQATGVGSTSFGYFTTASGTTPVGPLLVGGLATAFGLGTTASGSVATAFGESTIASGAVSTAFGSSTQATGESSTAYGTGTLASAYNAVAFGINNTSSNNVATSFGQENEASGVASLAFGQETQATQINATSFGLQTLASGGASTAFGISSVASGGASTAFGYNTIAPSSYETAIGMYNSNYTPVVSGSGYSLQDRIFVIGNGTSDIARSNALTIYKSGLININDAYDMPIADGNAGQVMTTDGNGVVSFQNVNLTPTVYTLNQSYSQGGTGNGRIINAIYGPVEIQNNGGLIVSSLNQPNMLFVDGANDEVGIGTNAPTASFSVNGTANKPGGGAWAVFSDERLKHNVSNYEEGLDFIMKVNPVNFSYNEKISEILGTNNLSTTHVFQGVIAQDLQKIAPDMVRKVHVGNQSFLEVDPNKFTYALINAVKEQQKIIEKQGEQIQRLEHLFNALGDASKN